MKPTTVPQAFEYWLSDITPQLKPALTGKSSYVADLYYEVLIAGCVALHLYKRITAHLLSFQVQSVATVLSTAGTQAALLDGTERHSTEVVTPTAANSSPLAKGVRDIRTALQQAQSAHAEVSRGLSGMYMRTFDESNRRALRTLVDVLTGLVPGIDLVKTLVRMRSARRDSALGAARAVATQEESLNDFDLVNLAAAVLLAKLDSPPDLELSPDTLSSAVDETLRETRKEVERNYTPSSQR